MDELLLRGFNWLWLASDLLYRLIYEVNLQSTVGKIDSLVTDRSCYLNRAWKILCHLSPHHKHPLSYLKTALHRKLLDPKLALCVLFIKSDTCCYFRICREKNIQLICRIICFAFPIIVFKPPTQFYI